MLEVSVVDMNNNRVGSMEREEKIFGQPVNTGLLHEAVVMQLNNRRQGTHCTKTKGLVRGGGKKPWKQKSTRRAKAGSLRPPPRGGGGAHLRSVAEGLFLSAHPEKEQACTLHRAILQAE